MAFYVLLLTIALHFISANGFGIRVQRIPLTMRIRIPSGAPSPFQSPFGGASPMGLPTAMGLPSPMGMPLDMMAFPPIFNPMEAMNEEMNVGAREDINGPMGNVTTKNKTESKDGFKVTTIESDGPGFHSYIKEYEKEGNETGNATSGTSPSPEAGPPTDIGSLLSSGKIFDIMNKLKNMDTKKKPKCKKCGKGKFCDPIFHLCRKKFAEGRTCMAQKQCGKNLRCQWGKCQKAKKGDPGTFCKANSHCNGDSCCRNTPGSFHLMCIPQQSEGAICGLHERTESVAKLFYVMKRSTVATPTCSPCKTGLKCASTGGTRFKRCAKDTYIEKASDELEDDNPSNAITDDKDETKEEGSGEPPKDVAPQVPEPHDKQNEDKDDDEDKKDDEDDKEEEKDDKDDKKDEEKDDDDADKDEEDKQLSNDDEVEEDDEDDKNKQKKKKPINNGDGMDIQVPKSKKKKGGKKGRTGKRKDKKE